MRIRYVFALLALGIFFAPSYAERKKVQAAPDTPELPPVVAPIEERLLVQVQDIKVSVPKLADSVRTAAAVDGRDLVRTYHVADLVIPVPPMCNKGALAGSLTEPMRTTEKELIKNIQQYVEPAIWSTKGGSGTIEYFPIGYSLVINASATVHEKVAAYLETLRKKLDTQISMEIRVITLSEALFGDLALAKAFELSDSPANKAKVKFISEEQAKKFLERIQMDQKTSVLMAPKITALDGQECSIQTLDSQMFVTSVVARSVGEQLLFEPKNETIETGFLAHLRPQLSVDGTKIGLEAKISFKQLAETPVAMTGLTTMIRPVDDKGGKGESIPFTQMIQHPKVIERAINETANIPVGRSVIMYAGQATVKSPQLEQLGPPAIAKIPYLLRLFKNSEPQAHTDHLIVLITPRVIKPDCDAEECEVAPKAKPSRLTELLTAYHQACKDGKVDEARRLAIECLTLDPMCFKK